MHRLLGFLSGLALVWWMAVRPRSWLRAVCRARREAKTSWGCIAWATKSLGAPALLLVMIVQFTLRSIDLTAAGPSIRDHPVLRFMLNGYDFWGVGTLTADAIIIFAVVLASVLTVGSAAIAREFRGNRRRIQNLFVFEIQVYTAMLSCIVIVAAACLAMVRMDPQGVSIAAMLDGDARLHLARASPLPVAFLMTFVMIELLLFYLSVRLMLVFAGAFRIGLGRSIWLRMRPFLALELVVVVVAAGFALGGYSLGGPIGSPGVTETLNASSSNHNLP